ncbi:hypothetical protein ACIPXV_09810 [Streptomyces libani]|uniref:hypothetical protein n=1 Tax=Streptomyces nigrescens TaxID=1920 RepID=UPI003802E94B
MRIRAAAVGVVLLAGLATGCSAAGEAAPSKSPKLPVASPSLSKAEVTEQCIDAVAAQANGDEDKPEECAPLSDSEYLDANFKGVQQHNEDGQDELQRQIEEARESDAAN